LLSITYEQCCRFPSFVTQKLYFLSPVIIGSLTFWKNDENHYMPPKNKLKK
jgi:hypothetical protein